MSLVSRLFQLSHRAPHVDVSMLKAHGQLDGDHASDADEKMLVSEFVLDECAVRVWDGGKQLLAFTHLLSKAARPSFLLFVKKKGLF